MRFYNTTYIEFIHRYINLVGFLVGWQYIPHLGLALPNMSSGYLSPTYTHIYLTYTLVCLCNKYWKNKWLNIDKQKQCIVLIIERWYGKCNWQCNKRFTEDPFAAHALNYTICARTPYSKLPKSAIDTTQWACRTESKSISSSYTKQPYLHARDYVPATIHIKDV